MHNTQTKKNVPELRFPEFEGEWEEKKLGEVTEINTGKSNVANIENGQYINLGSTGIIGRANKYDYHGQFILIARVGHYAGSLYKFKGKVNISDNTIFIQIRSSRVFLYFQLEQYNLRRFVFGSGQLLIKSSEIKKLKIKLPSINEQQKIGTFFSKLDHQIELAENKVSLLQEQKKGYMQKIFSQELRFKDENGNDYPEWEEKKLGDEVSVLKGNKSQYNIEVMTISARNGWMSQKDRFSQVIAGKSLEKYVELNKGDLSYNKGNSKVAPFGIVYRIPYSKALVPNVYKSFRVSNNIDSFFLEKYFHAKKLDRQLRKKITSTARMDGLLNISDKEFFDSMINIPCKNEQQKIGAFFSKLDQRIELAEQKVEQLKEQKRGLLQKMFV
ncbi:restriction endonuclease subunit S [Staphylococcus sp. IVB6181]|uniref:restriction endonuclease subunit S n=1 Tax=Staphylococcus sp. IVB6181 TaxID=2929481 RepID=UPI0021D21EF6|nr:restriction endonuclease subunit S [Staphylococcus sp. IVB6181]UXV35891.1 restriction endonuclease subunit S [Staphylococcus sp. IVB6181]